MGHTGEKSVPGRGRRTQVAGSKELPLAMLQQGEASDKPLLCSTLKIALTEATCETKTKKRCRNTLPRKAQRRVPRDLGPPRRQILAPTRTCQWLEWAKARLGIASKVSLRAAGLEGRGGRPDLKWQEPPSILLTGWTQGSLQSGGTRGKEIGGTRAEGEPTSH